MTTTNSIVVTGIDVGKSQLDAHILDGGLDRQFDNSKTGRRALRNWLLRHGVTRAVFELTGRYHRNLHQCLFDAGIQTVLVNPLRSRRFAEAIGQLAKNDRVDDAMLARGGRCHPRHLLYMAATAAIRCEPASKACYERLLTQGKPHKVALVAVMRKLVSVLTGLLREDRLWQPEAPSCELEAAA